MSRNHELQRIVNRLNQLRISRRDIEREEAVLFRELREHIPEPTEVPLETVSSEEIEENRVKVEPDVEEPNRTVKEEERSVGEPRPPVLGIIRPSIKLEQGTRVFITNDISHYQEREGTSYHHRLASVTEHLHRTGRVHFVTDSGHHLWRKKKNLNLVLEE